MSDSEENPLIGVAKTERKFLHDVSNPLCVAHGMLELALSKLKETESEDNAIAKLEKAYNAIERTMKLVEERRSFVKSHDPD